jgi:hypothetical protein
LLNPIHAAFKDPILWEAEGEVVLNDRGLKVGCETLTTVRRLPLPEVTTTQRVAFGILCAKEVCKNAAWNSWADAWLDGRDRSYTAVNRAADRVACAHADHAAHAAYFAAHDAVSAAVVSAARAAYDAAHVAAGIDLIAIAKKCLEYT